MNWAANYQSKRDQYWPEVGRFFSDLPPHLFQQGVLLKNNLATFYSDTGQFEDILRRNHDHPLLYLHFWLLDDWHCPDGTERRALEKNLFLAMAFAFAAVNTHASIRDEGSNFDHQHLFLAQALTRQADFHLAQLFPGPAPFWEYHRTFWNEYAEASLMTADRRRLTAGPLSGKLAFSKIPIVGVMLNPSLKFTKFVEQGDTLSQLCQLMDRLNFVHQTLQEISTLRRDLSQRNYTYPLLRAVQEAGLRPQQSAQEQILGALVLTDTVEKIGQECLSALAKCHSTAETFNLPTFTTYFAVVEEWVGEVTAMFSIKSKAQTSKDRSAVAKQNRPFFAPYVDTLPTVIEMAERYLLADLTFKESWEIQRRGAFGVSELTAKAFPSGLIVEVLCRHGHDMSKPVDMIFQTLRATGYRYYDYPRMPPDADDLGLLLRLYPYSRQPAAHWEILQTPLRWLKRNFRVSGEIPVWFTENDEGVESAFPFVSLWGQNCVTVAANVLLGLFDFDFWGYRHLIEKSARSILERWSTQGLGATLHYVPLYSLWVAFELIARIAASPLKAVLQSQLNQAANVLVERLQIEIERPLLTPQDAACLTLACLSDGCPIPAKNLFNPRWITILCKSQRYDGSWSSEPLFGTPTRGELATWYASRSVTTAYCYHALKAVGEVHKGHTSTKNCR